MRWGAEKIIVAAVLPMACTTVLLAIASASTSDQPSISPALGDCLGPQQISRRGFEGGEGLRVCKSWILRRISLEVACTGQPEDMLQPWLPCAGQKKDHKNKSCEHSH